MSNLYDDDTDWGVRQGPNVTPGGSITHETAYDADHGMHRVWTIDVPPLKKGSWQEKLVHVGLALIHEGLLKSAPFGTAYPEDLAAAKALLGIIRDSEE